MRTILARLTYLLVGWLSIGFVYNGTAYLSITATVLEPSFIDTLIPFSPHAVWLYLSFFLIIPFCFFYAPYSRVRWMSICFIVTALVAGVCYLILPTTMIFPIDTGTSISSLVLRQLITIDVTQNCCPSLHVALTMIVIWGCLDKQKLIVSLLLILWGTGICFSIIQLKRHLFIDFIGGGVLALLVGYSVQYVLSRFRGYRCNASIREPLV